MRNSNSSSVKRPLLRWRARLTLYNMPAVLARWTVVNFGIAVVCFRLMVAGIRWKASRGRKDSRPRILRQFFEYCGGSWIKLGQQLAIRIDFLSTELVNELSSLLDKVPPFKYEIARKIIIEDLGDTPENIFDEFPEKTIAAASFGQVYDARLNNRRVAVKIQRPGLKNIIVADVYQMRMLASVLDGLGLFGSIRFKPLVKELTSMLEEEADYNWEIANLHDALQTSANLRIMKVPDLYADHSSAKIITMEYLEGVWVNQILKALRNNDRQKIDKWEAGGMDFKLIGRRIFDIGMRQIFEVQKFNADPHAANIVIMADNVVGYVDYGLIGSVSRSLLNNQRKYFEAVFNNKADDAAQMVLQLVIVPKGADARVEEFRQDLAMQIQSWISNSNEANSPINYKSTARLLIDNIALIRKYRFSLVNNVARYYRALITSDVIILQLDEDFNFSEHLARYFRNKLVRETRVELQRNPPEKLFMEYFQLFLQGPRILKRYEERFDESQEFVQETQNRLRNWIRSIEVMSMLALLTVLVARAFGVHDVGQYIGFPVALDWRWLSIALFLLWRTCRAFQ